MMKKLDVMVSEVIERRILMIRGQKVLLSIDLARLYEVEHKVLMQAVHRNFERVPRRLYVSAYEE